jgi:hypothetical protein
VLPFLTLLLCGIIDFGSLYSDYQSLRSGARDGTRQAAVANFGSNTSCGITGSSGSTTASKIICDVKNKTGLGNGVRVGIWTPGNWTVGATLRVCAQYGLSSLTGFTSSFFSGKVMTSKVEFRIELAMPTTEGTWAAGQETALTSWPSSCTTGT